MLYIGSTNNVYRRIDEHNKGKSTFTKNKGPWTLIFVEHFETRKDAYRRELYLKSLKKRSSLEKIILAPIV